MLITYNVDLKSTVSVGGGAVAPVPTLYLLDKVTWDLRLVNAQGTAVNIDDVASWRAAVDNDFKSETDPMCRTLSESITVETITDPITATVIRVPIDAATPRFSEVLDGKESADARFELYGFNAQKSRILTLSIKIKCNNVIDPIGGTALPPGIDPIPDLPAQTPTGDYVRRMVDGVRSWAKIACATIADVTASILSHNTDKSAHKGVLIPEVPDESALFVRQGSGVGEWRWFKTSEGVIFGTDLYNHKIAQNAHTELFATRIAKSEKGVANGVASLDANSKIPMSQIPSLEYITEAPMDGKMYARKDGAWVEIAVAPPEPIAGTVLTDNDVQLTDNDNVLFF